MRPEANQRPLMPAFMRFAAVALPVALGLASGLSAALVLCAALGWL